MHLDRVDRLGSTSGVIKVPVLVRRVGRVLRVFSAISVAIGVGIVMVNEGHARQRATACLSASKLFGQTKFLILCVVSGPATVRDRRVRQFANFRVGRNAGQASVAVRFTVLTVGKGVAINGGTVRIFGPYVGKGLHMLPERVLRLGNRAKGCPYVILLLRLYGARVALKKVRANTIRGVISRRTRGGTTNRVRVGEFNRGEMQASFAVYRVLLFVYLPLLLLVVGLTAFHGGLIRVLHTTLYGDGAAKACMLRRATVFIRDVMGQGCLVYRSLLTCCYVDKVRVCGAHAICSSHF